MRTKLYIPILLLIFFQSGFGQTSVPEYFVTLNTNLYLPWNSSEKFTFPMLGYNKNSEPKIQVGGFGVGAGFFAPFKSKLSLKEQLNLFRFVYWDNPYRLRTLAGEPLGSSSSHSNNYTIGSQTTVHYFLSDEVSIGSGLGLQLLLKSSSKINAPKTRLDNNGYKLLMPSLPLEFSFKSKRILINTRYEFALLNRFRGDLAKYKKDRFGLLTIEFGVKIN